MFLGIGAGADGHMGVTGIGCAHAFQVARGLTLPVASVSVPLFGRERVSIMRYNCHTAVGGILG